MSSSAPRDAPKRTMRLAASNAKILAILILANLMLTLLLVSVPVLVVVFGLGSLLQTSSPLTVSQAGQADSLGPGMFLCPVQHPTVTQPFGPTSFSSEPIINGVHFHTGIDLAVPQGTPIVAASTGTVTFAGAQTNAFGVFTGYGQYVMIADGQGRVELYGHMSQIQATSGEAVQAGQQIGLVGTTGNSTGPHVHFEVRVNGQPVDPSPNLRC